MKKRIFIILLLIFGFNSLVFCQTPMYVLLNNNQYLEVGDRPIFLSFHSITYSQLPVFENIASSATAQVNPRNSIGGNSDSTPNLYYGGLLLGPVLADIYVEFGAVPIGVLANTILTGTSSTSSGPFTKFRIIMGEFKPWANGAVPLRFDIGTVYQHELCHGIGLGHNFIGNSEELMSTQQSVNDVDFFGSHEKEGFRKIYFDINCFTCYLSGNVKFTKTLKEISITSSRQVDWKLEERGISSKFVLGFNIFKKENNKIISLNKELILADSDKVDYSYVIENYDTAIYYIEIVTDDKTFNRFLKLNDDE